MDAELRCFMALDALGLEMLPGETALDAVLRNLALVDTVVRPFRYPQADGMRHAFQTWIDLGGVRALQGGETADTLNTFQAGYTARGAGNERLPQVGNAGAAASQQPGPGDGD